MVKTSAGLRTVLSVATCNSDIFITTALPGRKTTYQINVYAVQYPMATFHSHATFSLLAAVLVVATPCAPPPGAQGVATTETAARRLRDVSKTHVSVAGDGTQFPLGFYHRGNMDLMFTWRKDAQVLCLGHWKMVGMERLFSALWSLKLDISSVVTLQNDRRDW